MDLRLCYAPEVERALVSLLWHKPEHLASVLRELDPAKHIFEPANRILLEALNVVYRHLNASDWATVITYLREIDQLDELGGLDNLNSIYSRPGYESLLAHYLQLLKHYAASRSAEPTRPAHFFHLGRAILRPNKKNYPSEPDFVGNAQVAGQFYTLKAWQAPDGRPELQIRFEFEPKKGQSCQTHQPPTPSMIYASAPSPRHRR